MKLSRRLALLGFVAAWIVVWGGAPMGQRRPTRSADLENAGARGERVRVIVQAETTSALADLRLRYGGVLRRELAGAVVLELSGAELDALSRNPAVAHISGDLPVRADMAVTNVVTRAENVWEGTSGVLGLLGSSGYNGSGIGIAIVDSGIARHSAIGDRVVARVNFVSTEPGVTGDPFGHGTHIAGTAGGNTTAARKVTKAFTGGSAPAVRFVDIRVLGANGTGYTSDVIAGIDWAIENRAKYGIRILNLSLGHPVMESASTDPLCLAVERATKAGLIVVASAGNYGRTAGGAPVLGGIMSPGNSPYAITVGALDTAGTTDTTDDRIAPYSSRGPTKYDFAVKPDVVAPGSRLVSLEAAGSVLLATYPSWHVAGTGKNAYFRMSGSSMATAVVSGGIALLLDAEPDLTPAQVRLALQMGARFVADGGLIGGGTGSVNFETSLRLAQSGLVPTLGSTQDQLLGTSSGASYRDRGTLVDRVYDRSGIRLLDSLAAALLWDTADSAEYGVLNLLGLTNPLADTPANYLVWGETAGWTDSYYVVWGTTMQSPEGQYVVWGTHDPDGGEYVVWGTGRIEDDGR